MRSRNATAPETTTDLHKTALTSRAVFLSPSRGLVSFEFFNLACAADRHRIGFVTSITSNRHRFCLFPYNRARRVRDLAMEAAMGSVRFLLRAVVLGGLLGGCSHYGSAAGDVAIAPDVAANTTVLRVANRYTADMRIYSVIGGKQHYLGKVAAHATREFVMNPDLVGESGISFSARESNDDGRRRFRGARISSTEAASSSLRSPIATSTM